MATNSITNLTPPRVAIIDPNTGLISREWYMFFLNLYNITAGPDSNAPDLLLLAPDAQSEFAALQSQIDMLRQDVDQVTKHELGTVSAYNIDNMPYVGFGAAPSWIGAAAGQMWFDTITGSLNVKMGNNNITQQVGEEFYRYGKASAAISDTNLQLVYKTGVVGASGVITFAPTVAGITDPDQILGIATETIAHNGFGRITTAGVVHGINTTGSVYGETWADNDDIWYNPVTGGLTKTKPVAPNIKLQVGTVINAGSGGSGSFSVKLGSSSALGGTDSNVQLSSLADGDILQYYGTGSYWRNVAVLDTAHGGTGTSTVFTAGSIVFAGASGVYSQNNAMLFFDAATNNLGVKTATPSAALHVAGPALLDGVVYKYMPTPITKAAAATLTAGEILNGFLQYTGAAANITLTNATNIQAAMNAGMQTDYDNAFEWVLINTGTGTATVVVNTGITAVGALTVPIGTSGIFRFRHTAANTFILYRC